MAATVGTGKGRGKAANTPGKNFADNGIQPDGKKRYPLDTAEEIKAAWSYIHQSRDAQKYNSHQLHHIKSAIQSAARSKGIKLKSDHDGDNDG
jgi:hypothetical protein